MNISQLVVSRLNQVKALPVSARRAAELMTRDDVEFADFLDAAKFDPSLTATLLRLSNAAALGPSNRIGTLDEAVVRLGMERLKRIFVTSMVADTAGGVVEGYALMRGELLQHCVAVAMCAEALCAACGAAAPGRAFTAGLLHDIGKIVLGGFIGGYDGAITKHAYEHKVSFEHAERDILGVDHAEVGEMLLKQWELPEELCRAVRWHHAPCDADGDPYPLLDSVHVADCLCVEMGLGVGVDGLNYTPRNDSLDRLGLSEEMLERALLKTLMDVKDLSDALGIGACAA